MTTFRLLLCLLLAVWAMLAVVFVTAEPHGVRGVPHDEFTAMLQGGAAASPRVALSGWVFGVLQIAIFITCMTLGISRRRFGFPDSTATASSTNGRGGLYVLFGAGGAAYFGAFTLMVWAERTATVSGEITFLGPFPAATSWMLFGMWAAPLFFVAAYIVGFSRWIITNEDLARFEELVARSQQAESGSP